MPVVFLYGGTILPGRLADRHITIQDVFEAIGAHAAGTCPTSELLAVERAACPGAGSCAGMYTANTMAACAEALGMALPGSRPRRPCRPSATDLARRTGEAVAARWRPGSPRGRS